MNRVITITRSLLALLLWLSATTLAQTFPDRPINLVVAYTAGGSTDVVMRVLADIAGKHLGQRVIVVAGIPLGTPGATNMLRIAYVGANATDSN